MRIGKLRRKLKDEKFLRRKLTRLIGESERWNRFRQFKCDNFFVGHVAAKHNREIYDRNVDRIVRQIEFITQLIADKYKS